MQVENFKQNPPAPEHEAMAKVAAAAYIPSGKGLESTTSSGGSVPNDQFASRREDLTPKERAIKVADNAGEAVKADIDGLFKSGVPDLQSGKWSDASKQGWKKLVEDMKAAHIPESQIGTVLNGVGAGLNEVAESKGVTNHVGMATLEGAKGQKDFYMLLNTGANRVQNALDAGMGHETDTVVKAGSTGGENLGTPI